MEEMAAKLPEVSLGGSVLKLPRAKNGSEFGVCFRVFDLSNFQNASPLEPLQLRVSSKTREKLLNMSQNLRICLSTPDVGQVSRTQSGPLFPTTGGSPSLCAFDRAMGACHSDSDAGVPTSTFAAPRFIGSSTNLSVGSKEHQGTMDVYMPMGVYIYVYIYIYIIIIYIYIHIVYKYKQQHNYAYIYTYSQGVETT